MYVHIHTQWNTILSSHKNERNFTTCSNMDRLGGYYAKWNKSDRERQILYDISVISENNKEADS